MQECTYYSNLEDTMIMRILRLMFVLSTIATVLTATNIAQAQQAITDGLISYWSFNQNTVVDKTINDVFGTNNGTMDGNVEVVNGKIGDALKFSGGHVDCGSAKDLIEIGDQVTLEMWIKPEKAGWAIIAGISKSGSNTYVLAWSDQTRVDFNIWNGAVETWPLHSVAQPTLNEWHHVAGVYDGSEAIIYINGEIDSKKDFEGNLKHNGENFWMGARNVGGLQYNGLIDELRIYNRGLSQDEVKNNLEATGLAVEPSNKLALTWGMIKVSE